MQYLVSRDARVWVGSFLRFFFEVLFSPDLQSRRPAARPSQPTQRATLFPESGSVDEAGHRAQLRFLRGAITISSGVPRTISESIGEFQNPAFCSPTPDVLS